MEVRWCIRIIMCIYIQIRSRYSLQSDLKKMWFCCSGPYTLHAWHTRWLNQTFQFTDTKPKQRRWVEGSNLERWWDLNELYGELCGATSSFPITSWEMILFKLRNVWSLCPWSRPFTCVSGLLLKTWESKAPNAWVGRGQRQPTKRCRTATRFLVTINTKATGIKTVGLNQIPVQCGTTMRLSFFTLTWYI